VTLVSDVIVSDAVFDGLSDRLLQLARSIPGHDLRAMTRSGVWKPSNGSTKATVGGNFSTIDGGVQ